jgi:predicted nuclease with TOPRIM domain
MSKIQEIYDRIKEFKEEQKIIREAYKNELSNNGDYQEIKDELDSLKQKKKEIEADIKRSMSNDFIKLEDLKLDIDTDNEMISDLAINQIMKGETVQIEDEFGNKYDPIITVKFKKA